MCVHHVKSSIALRLGLALLAVANIVNFVVRKNHGDVDFVTGLLFGSAFGLLMLAMWRDRGDRSAS
jgi:hypothetical protein